MAVKITALDYRSTDALIDAQETAINSFLSTRTLQFVTVVDEFLIGVFLNVPPVTAHKVKIFKAVDNIVNNGIASTETLIANFLVGKTVTQLINLDSGAILIVYQ